MIALRARKALIDGRERFDWWVTIAGEFITDVSASPPPAVELLDLGDVELIPGLVDLHSDCLEVKAHPRPNTELPLGAALLELDAELAAHGITTHFLCVSLEDDSAKYRGTSRAFETVDLVRAMRPDLRVDHRIHLRVDVTGDNVATARELLGRDVVKLVSYMDHTPGQGQYADETDWRAFYTSVHGLEEDELSQRLAVKRAGQPLADGRRMALSALAAQEGIALASHDDDSAATVERAIGLGVSFAEFPVSVAAAAAARVAGLGIVMGAPNARRGRSHLTNLSAREALSRGCLDALASDYHPPSLLAAAYSLVDNDLCSWPEAIALITSGPARLALLTDRGRLEPGLRADLVAVARQGDYRLVRQTWVSGRPILGFVPQPAATR